MRHFKIEDALIIYMTADTTTATETLKDMGRLIFLLLFQSEFDLETIRLLWIPKSLPVYIV